MKSTFFRLFLFVFGFVLIYNLELNPPYVCNSDYDKKNPPNASFSHPCPSGNYLVEYYPRYYAADGILQRSIDSLSKRNWNVEALVGKLVPKKTISIYVLGGSLTAGRMVDGFEGAWPHMLHYLLNDHLSPRLSFKILNKAEPGTTMLWALHRLNSLVPTSENVDIVILDYDVNDCAVISNSLESKFEIQAITEVMIRRLSDHPSKPLVLFLDVAVNHHGRPMKWDCSMFETCYSLQEIRTPILSHYGIPLVSQRDAIWSFFDCPPPSTLWPCSTFCSHPHENAHNLLADIVFGFLTNQSSCGGSNQTRKPFDFYRDGNTMWKSSVSLSWQNDYKMPINNFQDNLKSDFLVPSSILLNQSICHVPLVDYVREPTERPVFRSNTSCWKYVQDSQEKFGWIGEDCLGDSIYFQVIFGDNPMLFVSMLTTYSLNFGLAEFSISNETWDPTKFSQMTFHRIAVLDSIRPENEWGRHSLTTTQVLMPSSYSTAKHGNHHYFTTFLPENTFKSGNSYILKITLVDANAHEWKPFQSRPHIRQSPQKFKIVSVSAC